jgi:hypothetical protein
MDCDVDAFTFLAWAPIIEFEGAGGDIIDWEGRDLCWKASPDSLSTPGSFKVLAAGDRQMHIKAIEGLIIY